MNRKFIFLVLSCICSFAFAPESNDKLSWHTDFKRALQESKTSQKPIFIFFTGSDWCGWCKKIQKEIFSKPEFIKWANDSVTLMEADFPVNKVLPAEIAKQNDDLKNLFGVQGFPTIWIIQVVQEEGVNSEFQVSVLGTLGYPRDAEKGREEIRFINDANYILQKK